MRIIKETDISIPDIIAVLKQGGVLVYPTETCYGLGCDATNAQAVQKIFDIKQRQRDKSVLVVASDISMMMHCVEWNDQLERIAHHYWPGPVTVVTRVKNQACKAPSGVVAADGTIAFRITAHPLAARLSHELGKPLVSTSANISQHESPYNIASVLSMFEGAQHQPDIVIDAGELPFRSPSTIVRVDNKHIEILRQGEIVVEI